MLTHLTHDDIALISFVSLLVGGAIGYALNEYFSTRAFDRRLSALENWR